MGGVIIFTSSLGNSSLVQIAFQSVELFSRRTNVQGGRRRSGLIASFHEDSYEYVSVEHGVVALGGAASYYYWLQCLCVLATTQSQLNWIRDSLIQALSCLAQQDRRTTQLTSMTKISHEIAHTGPC